MRSVGVSREPGFDCNAQMPGTGINDGMNLIGPTYDDVRNGVHTITALMSVIVYCDGQNQMPPTRTDTMYGTYVVLVHGLNSWKICGQFLVDSSACCFFGGPNGASWVPVVYFYEVKRKVLKKTCVPCRREAIFEPSRPEAFRETTTRDNVHFYQGKVLFHIGMCAFTRVSGRILFVCALKLSG